MILSVRGKRSLNCISALPGWNWDVVPFRCFLRCCSGREVEMQMLSMQKDLAVFEGSLGWGVSFGIRSVAAFLILGCAP